VVVLLTWGSTLSFQVYRYMRVYTYSERQQTKWLVFGITSGLLLEGASALIGNLLPALSRPDSPYQLLVFNLEGLVIFLLIALSVGIALLRYQLWNIDIIINRALVYGALTVILTAVYVGLVIGLQALLRGFISQDNGVAIVISTLAIAALFQPLRQRLQQLIDRRFYRSKYDAAKIVAAFSATLRQEVDLDQVREQLLAVVQETMQPAHISLWLRRPTKTETLPREDGQSPF
jgi:divalent metal cation (Fe/Co/Zn/Cd) transporter